MSPPTRPVLRYHGGKWRLAPWIISHFPAHRIYVEPYGGAASVLMRKPRSFAEVYNDLEEDIVNVFRVLRDPETAETAEALRELVYLTPYSRSEFLQSYEPCDDHVEQARRTISRAYMAHGTTSRKANGTGFRAKNHRQNQAVSRSWATWPAHVASFVERLRGVTIEARPALEVIAQQDTPDTLFYLDPPYVLHTRTKGAAHRRERAYGHNLTDADHAELAAVLLEIKGAAIISGYPCDLYDDLYSGWARVEKQAQIDGGGANRTEVLWISPRAEFPPLQLEGFA